jgi:hypothetical protein
MKVTDWVRRVLPIERRKRKCLRECKTLNGPRYPENSSFVWCEKHLVWSWRPDA